MDFGDDSAPEHFFLADIRNTDGTPWDCCPRQFLKRALEDLRQEAGLQLLSAFEHEFFYTGVEPQANSAYNLEAFRRQGLFAEVLIQALRNADAEPETFMAEYGPCQYELTCSPALGLQAADRAVIVRELTRATAQRLGHRASFSPILDPNSVGNGVHIHMSLLDEDGQPVTYDPQHRYGLSAVAGHFVAGILRHLPALCALTAASVISYLRLTPNHWSAAYNNLGYRDREASVRICPLLELSDTESAHQFNVEYRAADAAARMLICVTSVQRPKSVVRPRRLQRHRHRSAQALGTESGSLWTQPDHHRSGFDFNLDLPAPGLVWGQGAGFSDGQFLPLTKVEVRRRVIGRQRP